MGRIFTIAIILVAGYWYWSGPYQNRANRQLEQNFKDNAEKMRLCIRTENYKLGATGEGRGNPEEYCAEKYKLYLLEGRWYSYDEVRK